MTRQARLQVSDTIYHITSRGDRREEIYKDDVDRQNWLRVLNDVCQRFDWRVHAFCQMGNHYHLVAETLTNNLSAGMHRLNGVYTQRFNYRHGGSGHVFQGRFHSEIVHRQAHLLETMRYVILNPVRAGMVATPGGWPWSSYAMTCDVTRAPAWLETEWVLEQFGERHEDAVMAFRRFVADGMENGDRPGHERPAGPVPDAASAAK
jgi:REP element-mobilizing transposase RayT